MNESIQNVHDFDTSGMIYLDFRVGSNNLVKMIASRSGTIPDYSKERLALMKQISQRQAQSLSAETAVVSDDEKRVGLFADDMPQSIVTRIYNYHLYAVMLCGDESEVMIDNLRRTLVPDICKDIHIYKYVKVEKTFDMSSLKRFEGVVDALAVQFLSEDLRADFFNNYSINTPCFSFDYPLEITTS